MGDNQVVENSLENKPNECPQSGSVTADISSTLGGFVDTDENK